MKISNKGTALLVFLLCSGCHDASQQNVDMRSACTVPRADILPLANGRVLHVSAYKSLEKVEGKLERNRCLVVGFNGKMQLTAPVKSEPIVVDVSVATTFRQYQPKAGPITSAAKGPWLRHQKYSFSTAYGSTDSAHRSLLVKFADSSRVLECSTAEVELDLKTYEPIILNGVCTLSVDERGAQGSVLFNAADLSALGPLLDAAINQVTQSIEPDIEQLEGMTYFKYLPANRAPKLYFKGADDVPVELYCGCNNRCEIPDRWYTPTPSTVHIKRFGFGLPVVFQLKNKQTSHVTNYPACKK